MEEINKPFNLDSLVDKLKSNDPQAEALMRDYKGYLLKKYTSKNWEVYADMGKAYEDAGLLKKAKNMYYEAYAYAEKSSEFTRAEELLIKTKSLPGEVE